MRPIRSYGPWILSSIALALSLLSFYRYDYLAKEEQDRFRIKLLENVKACIDYNKDIPEKDKIQVLLAAMEQDLKVVETGNDDLRIKYVNSQGCIEHVLACSQALGEIDQLIGVIHTPMPATPLCIKPEGNFEGILDETIRYDLRKLLTVRSRAQIVREYLMKGAKLYVVYPKGGFEKRTTDQQKIYREELERYAGSLIDSVLASTNIEPDMIGATYLFRNPQRQVFAFSIKSRQANDIQTQAEWGMWFGPVLEPTICSRVNEVFDYIATEGGPDVRREIRDFPSI